MIELAIVLTIMGLLLAAFLQFYSIWLAKEQMKLTKQRLRDIRSALTLYVTTHDQLPCPESPSGKTVDGYCTPGVKPPEDIVVHDVDPKSQDEKVQIWIGALPVKELRLDGEQALDGWGNRFTYAVSRKLTLPRAMRGNPLPKGNIDVVDANGHNVLDKEKTGRYVVISSGPSGQGAWQPGGGRKPCAEETLDSTNCRNTGTFVMAPWSMVRNENFYDDVVIHDDPNAGGSLMDLIALCNAKEAFYKPLDPKADSDGCKQWDHVWRGACLRSITVDSDGKESPLKPRAVMPPAAAGKTDCGCDGSLHSLKVGSWLGGYDPDLWVVATLPGEGPNGETIPGAFIATDALHVENGKVTGAKPVTFVRGPNGELVVQGVPQTMSANLRTELYTCIQ